jgi:hypothetical protein
MPSKTALPRPMHRLNYTKLTESQISTALAPFGTAGPSHASPLSDEFAGKSLRIVTDKGLTLEYKFTGNNKLTVSESGGKAISAGYGALVQDHICLFTHLIPGTLRGYAVVIDKDTKIATVIEVWFAGFEDKREVMREIYYGYVDAAGSTPPVKRHVTTNRAEGKAFYWKQDNGWETIDYWCSISYTHWVELSRQSEMGFSAPADYIQINDEFYIHTRTECEFSGTFTLYVTDLNRLQQIGLRLGFDWGDALDYYVFRGKGEWLGQIAQFEKLGDTSGGALPPNPNSSGQGAAAAAGSKGARAVYRPLRTMTKLSKEETARVVKANSRAFANRLGAGNGTGGMGLHALAASNHLVGKSFTLRYDTGLVMDYRVESMDSLSWRQNGGAWTKAIYQAYEPAPGVILFGHLLEGAPDHDGHSIVVDFDAGLVTCFNGYLNGPYIANDAQARTHFGVLEMEGVNTPLYKRHGRTWDLVGRCLTWNYSPTVSSMHLYSTPNTTSWVIFTAAGALGMQWSGPGDFIKIRDDLYFAYWLEEACNGTLGTIVINMRTMHDAGIGYHCGKDGLSMSTVGAHGRHAGKFDVKRFFDSSRKS